MNDPITDMLNQIRNGQAVAKQEVSVPLSGIKQEIARILLEEGFIANFKKPAKKEDRNFKIALKYNQGAPAISDLKRVSKPGQRIYLAASELKNIKGGKGIAIISTSKGLMTNKKARKMNIGGEVIAEIW